MAVGLWQICQVGSRASSCTMEWVWPDRIVIDSVSDS